MYEELKVISWPDPRLLKMSTPVEKIDADTRALAARMLELMREHKGVGLAAPQVGLNIRLFVMNPTGQPGDDRVYVNPELLELTGEAEAEEGCLSLPGITINVLRAANAKLKALNLEGQVVQEEQEGYVARIWQHETDHLNGTLLLDRMGPVARMSNRKKMAELREKYDEQNPPPPGQRPKKK